MTIGSLQRAPALFPQVPLRLPPPEEGERREVRKSPGGVVLVFRWLPPMPQQRS